MRSAASKGVNALHNEQIQPTDGAQMVYRNGLSKEKELQEKARQEMHLERGKTNLTPTADNRTKAQNMTSSLQNAIGKAPKPQYVCKYCGKLFNKNCDLERHKRRHTGEKPYRCSFCVMVFARKDVLQLHIRKHHGVEISDGKFKCLKCQGHFTDTDEIERHIPTHDGEGTCSKSIDSGRPFAKTMKCAADIGEHKPDESVEKFPSVQSSCERDQGCFGNRMNNVITCEASDMASRGDIGCQRDLGNQEIQATSECRHETNVINMPSVVVKPIDKTESSIVPISDCSVSSFAPRVNATQVNERTEHSSPTFPERKRRSDSHDQLPIKRWHSDSSAIVSLPSKEMKLNLFDTNRENVRNGTILSLKASTSRSLSTPEMQSTEIPRSPKYPVTEPVKSQLQPNHGIHALGYVSMDMSSEPLRRCSSAIDVDLSMINPGHMPPSPANWYMSPAINHPTVPFQRHLSSLLCDCNFCRSLDLNMRIPHCPQAAPLCSPSPDPFLNSPNNCLSICNPVTNFQHSMSQIYATNGCSVRNNLGLIDFRQCSRLDANFVNHRFPPCSSAIRGYPSGPFSSDSTSMHHPLQNHPGYNAPELTLLRESLHMKNTESVSANFRMPLRSQCIDTDSTCIQTTQIRSQGVGKDGISIQPTQVKQEVTDESLSPRIGDSYPFHDRRTSLRVKEELPSPVLSEMRAATGVRNNNVELESYEPDRGSSYSPGRFTGSPDHVMCNSSSTRMNGELNMHVTSPRRSAFTTYQRDKNNSVGELSPGVETVPNNPHLPPTASVRGVQPLGKLFGPSSVNSGGKSYPSMPRYELSAEEMDEFVASSITTIVKENHHKVYQCNICKKCLSQKGDLKRHLKIHLGQKDFICLFCSRGFIKNSDLQRHIRTRHTREKPYQCSQCLRKYARTDQLLDHMRMHLGDKRFECEVCHEKFLRRYELQKHLREHYHKDGALKTEPPEDEDFELDVVKVEVDSDGLVDDADTNGSCTSENECVSLADSAELKDNCGIPATDEDITCAMPSDEETARLEDRHPHGYDSTPCQTNSSIGHEIPHDEDKSPPSISGASLNSYSAPTYTSSAALTVGKDAAPCFSKDQCSSQTIEHSPLTFHEVSEGLSNDCVKCTNSQEISNVDLLKDHSVAGSDLKTNGHLADHTEFKSCSNDHQIQDIDREKPGHPNEHAKRLKQSRKSTSSQNACQVCRRTFSQRGDLKRHMKIHTGQRDFVCNFCPKAFIKRSDLKRHLLVHTQEKPFTCDLCQMKFSRKDQLQTHINRRCSKRGVSGLQSNETQCESIDFSAATSPRARGYSDSGDSGKSRLCQSTAGTNNQFVLPGASSSTAGMPCGNDYDCKSPLDQNMGCTVSEKQSDIDLMCSDGENSFICRNVQAADDACCVESVSEYSVNSSASSTGVCATAESIAKTKEKFIESSVSVVSMMCADFNVLDNVANLRPFLCNQCSLRFPTKDKLQIHLMLHSKESVERPRCSDCDSTFLDQKGLEEHTIVTHKVMKPYVCGYCCQTFVSGAELEVHITDHRAGVATGQT